MPHRGAQRYFWQQRCRLLVSPFRYFPVPYCIGAQRYFWQPRCHLPIYHLWNSLFLSRLRSSTRAPSRRPREKDGNARGPANRDGEDAPKTLTTIVTPTRVNNTAHRPTTPTRRSTRRKNSYRARRNHDDKYPQPSVSPTINLTLLGGDTECPLQVCLLSRSSVSTHFLSRSREAAVVLLFLPSDNIAYVCRSDVNRISFHKAAVVPMPLVFHQSPG